MKKTLLSLVISLSLVGVTACENPQATAVSTNKPSPLPHAITSVERWYDQKQVTRGNVLFQENCAVCHKPDASGTPNWSEPDAQGKLPPPPLNGTAHAWHHPLPILQRTVRVGGVPLGGTMPGFANKLNKEQINDVLAWVQSHWSDKIYSIWEERTQRVNSSPQRKTGLQIQLLEKRDVNK